MVAPKPRTTMRAVWTFLRRARDRFERFAREVPATSLRLQGVIDAIARVEHQMLHEDPDLPLRRLRSPKDAPDPEVNRVQALARRVTELEDAVRVREEQLAMLAHDLRGPLSPVMLLVSSLRAHLDNTDLVDRVAMRVRVDGVAHRLHALVHRLDMLLDATHLQTGEVALTPEAVNLVELTQQVVSEVSGAVYQPPEVRYLGVKALVGQWDRHRVDQIVRNLVTNALRFGAAQPIEIVFDKLDDRAVLVIRDRGIGMMAADLERIFDKHERLGRRGGAGLGLWIVKQLVDAMHGTISVRSGPGAGAEFKVTLPVGLSPSPRPFFDDVHRPADEVGDAAIAVERVPGERGRDGRPHSDPA